MSTNSGALAVCLMLAVGVQPAAWSGCITPAGASGSNPNSRYLISLSNQEVYDTKTDITWQRCPYGWFATPDGKTCLKLPGAQDTWSQRTDLTHTPRRPGGPNSIHNDGPPDWVERGWRIPSLTQLAGLLDRVCTSPAINQEVFPDTPAGYFQSSDYYPDVRGQFYVIRLVNFDNGDTGGRAPDFTPNPIRLMYPGKSPAIEATLEKRPVATQ